MSALAICTTHNRAGRHDGDEFVRECSRFVELHGADVLYYRDERPAARRRLAEQFLSSRGRVDCVAVFGHGTAGQLVCTGHRRLHLPGLVDALTSALNLQAATVVLYCCLTGRGFGIADELDVALELRGLNVRTIAHTSKGHVSWNPQTEDSGEGPTHHGLPLVPRASHLWPEWRRRLREDQDFRLSFWALSEAELIAELGGVAPAPLPENIKNQW